MKKIIMSFNILLFILMVQNENFLNAAELPTVSTLEVIDISANTATVRGRVISSSKVIERGVVYASTENPTISNFKVTITSTNEWYSVLLKGLIKETTYYARAFATNTSGTSYGNQIIIKTLAPRKLMAWGDNSQSQLGIANLNSYIQEQFGTDKNWNSITAGDSHILGIKEDGTLWAWGDNNAGQLGIGNNISQETPIQINAENNWKSVFAGGSHCLGIKEDGTLWAWGNNSSGQLGIGNNISQNTPIQVNNDNNWKNVSVGGSHCLAIKADGTLWAWGNNGSGQLGIGNNISQNKPIKVNSDNNWKSVSASKSHCLGLQDDGTLWAWGLNDFGQLGNGNQSQQTSPIKIGNTKWLSISAGFSHSLAINENGTLWAWGNGSNNELGIIGANKDTKQLIPIQVNSDNNWKFIYAKDGHSYAIKQNGTLWSCGGKYAGNSKLGYYGSEAVFSQVRSESNWKFIVSTINNCYGILNNGSLWTWGSNIYGKYKGYNNNEYYPKYVDNTSSWKNVTVGFIHSLAIKEDGTIWAWGNNGSGQLGIGNTITQDIPIQISPDNNWKNVFAGGSSQSLGNTEDGTLWAWGYHLIRNLEKHKIPNKYSIEFKSVSAGSRHALGIKEDGTLWAWGNNDSGQLGNGNQSQQTSPIKIGNSDKKWKSISAGLEHSLGIKEDGTLWAWGSNVTGELGNGNTISQSTPIQISSDKKWELVSAGEYFCLGIKEDGTLWAWGYNNSGELGIGNTINQSIPIQIDSNKNWKSVSVGLDHSLGIKEDGTIWAWGNNDSGQLGIGKTGNQLSPIQVGYSNGESTIIAGARHSFILVSSELILSDYPLILNYEKEICSNSIVKYEVFDKDYFSFKWELNGDYVIIDSTKNSITLQWKKSGKGQINLYRTNTNSNIITSLQLDLKILPPPLLNFKNNSVGCINDTLLFNFDSQADIIDYSILVKKNDVLINQNVINKSKEQFNLIFKEMGLYDLLAIATSINGCIDTTKLQLEILDSPIKPQLSYVQNVLTSSILNFKEHVWYIDNEFFTKTKTNKIYPFKEGIYTNYYIDLLGCSSVFSDPYNVIFNSVENEDNKNIRLLNANYNLIILQSEDKIVNYNNFTLYDILGNIINSEVNIIGNQIEIKPNSKLTSGSYFINITNFDNNIFNNTIKIQIN